MRRNLLASVMSSDGRSLETLMDELAKHLRARTSDTAVRIEDAETAINVTDPFLRDVLKRAFVATLKQGGANEDLTRDGKWLKGGEKWAPAHIKRGKVVDTYVKTTVPTAELQKTIEELNGSISDTAQDAAASIITSMNNRANIKLDRYTIVDVAESVSTLLADNAAINRELQVRTQHEAEIAKERAIADARFNEMFKLMQQAITKIPNQPGSDGSTKVSR